MMFDGYDVGYFDETDTQQTDTYVTNRIPKWYGEIIEDVNERTQFVRSRLIRFDALANAMLQRFKSISHLDEQMRRKLELSEGELSNVLSEQGRSLVSSNIAAGIDPRAIITTVDRFAYSAPMEIKLAAAVEYGTWLIRQPPESNHSNGIVRSGAATLLDPYKHRGL